MLRAATSVALVAVLVVANLASHWHQATVVHVRCAEHGELVHATPGVPQAADAAAEVAAVLPADGTAPGQADDGHHHCQLCPLTRPLPDARAPVVVGPAPMAVAIASPPATAVAYTSTDLVRIAPKTSPPV